MTAAAPPMAKKAGTRAGGRAMPWLENAVFAGALVPLAVLLYRAGTGRLGANPVAEALNELGLLALVLLLCSLACTPLKIVTGATWPIRVRKTLGNFGFFYAAMHLGTYVGVDQRFAWASIGKDIVARPFITIGMGAFLLLTPLAVTSTSGMLKRLGFKRWKKLHRLAYVAPALGVVHFTMRVKKDVREPLFYGAVLALFLGVRVFAWWRDRAKARAAG